MYCSYCGFENRPGTKFCPACGARLSVAATPAAISPVKAVCPACGLENAPGVKYCKYCGAVLETLGPNQKVTAYSPRETHAFNKRVYFKDSVVLWLTSLLIFISIFLPWYEVIISELGVYETIVLFPKSFFTMRGLVGLWLLVLIAIWPSIGLVILALKKSINVRKNEKGESLGIEAGFCAAFVYGVIAMAFHTATIHNAFRMGFGLTIGADIGVNLKAGFFIYLISVIMLFVHILYKSGPFLHEAAKTERRKYFIGFFVIAAPALLIGVSISFLLHTL